MALIDVVATLRISNAALESFMYDPNVFVSISALGRLRSFFLRSRS